MNAPVPNREHEPTVACEQDHCAIHNVDEPSYGVAEAIVCGECNHLVPNEVTLRKETVLVRARLGLTFKGAASLTEDDLASCPACGHDY